MRLHGTDTEAAGGGTGGDDALIQLPQQIGYLRQAERAHRQLVGDEGGIDLGGGAADVAAQLLHDFYPFCLLRGEQAAGDLVGRQFVHHRLARGGGLHGHMLG